MAAAQNALAQSFKALHIPGTPLILANVYDAVSARAVASLGNAKAIATASYSIAEAAGLKDATLTRAVNVAAVRNIASAIKEFGKPLSGITELLQIGVVGINLEDYDGGAKKLYSTSEAADRIQRTLRTAKAFGVPDFVVNARIDTLVQGGSLDEAIERGHAYLAAGATTVFVWGASRGVSRDEVVRLVKEFDGRLNVLLNLSGGLTTRELGKIGVARISVGPVLQIGAMAKLQKDAEAILSI
ncbi:Phosphoenolpyruvate/pyruvate domain-containing protein [Trichoderma citrinoviride]|uniref:Phosphoenolpyruvate/pyruvate domain-containing protein n=1 Tax=Trichoderma citrinoviride TaxID=58853 RepID=A0A2T4BEL0_9HYPO|nr:Phosphoenolpyruvate/pyruvate domain-containing protein [Trichoderma citrinoviride]PTB67746.1 Phosphoenolpyruvate/pyruvate domain-containing protein [Trichoderma citrinoviride]